MKNILKKTLASVMALTAAISISSVSSFGEKEIPQINEKQEQTVSSRCGKCGENAIWCFYEENHQLEISGSGAMFDYYRSEYEFEPSQEDTEAPWCEWRNEIESVVVKGGVSRIGMWAFSDCGNLKKVVIEEGVKVIDRNAFDCCPNLTEVSFPDGLEEIGAWAFYEDTALKNIDIPETVTGIDRAAFGCTGIKDAVIPDSVTMLGRDVFAGCENLESYKLPKNLEMMPRGLFACCPKLKNIVIPESIKGISRENFAGCTGLTEITLPENVESIGFCAFEGCENLEKINFSENVTYIAESAFEETAFVNNPENWNNGALYLNGCLILADKNFKGDFVVENGTRCIAVKAFYECEELTSVTIPASVESTGFSLSSYCPKLKSFVFLGDCIDEDFAQDFTDCTVYVYPDTKISGYAAANGAKTVLLDDVKPGDVNDDETVNSSDALSILQHVVNVNFLLGREYVAADVNQDGNIDSADALLVLEKAVRK